MNLDFDLYYCTITFFLVLYSLFPHFIVCDVIKLYNRSSMVLWAELFCHWAASFAELFATGLLRRAELIQLIRAGRNCRLALAFVLEPD